MAGKTLTIPRKDLTSLKFGMLTVLSFESYRFDRKHRKTGYWNVLCDCGTEKAIKQNSLVTGSSLSCGCLLDHFRKNILPDVTRIRNSLPAGEALINNLYSNYKYRAERHLKVPFGIPREQFIKLIKMPCFYCGVAAIQVFTKKKAPGSIRYNGLDRLDNTAGYLPENIVTCCGICNKAKRDLAASEFTNWIKRLSNYASKINFNYEIPDTGQ